MDERDEAEARRAAKKTLLGVGVPAPSSAAKKKIGPGAAKSAFGVSEKPKAPPPPKKKAAAPPPPSAKALAEIGKSAPAKPPPPRPADAAAAKPRERKKISFRGSPVVSADAKADAAQAFKPSAPGAKGRPQPADSAAAKAPPPPATKPDPPRARPAPPAPKPDPPEPKQSASAPRPAPQVSPPTPSTGVPDVSPDEKRRVARLKTALIERPPERERTLRRKPGPARSGWMYWMIPVVALVVTFGGVWTMTDDGQRWLASIGVVDAPAGVEPEPEVELEPEPELVAELDEAVAVPQDESDETPENPDDEESLAVGETTEPEDAEEATETEDAEDSEPAAPVEVRLLGVPRGAEVRVDGETAEGTSFVLERDGERHVVEVTAQGSEPWRREVVASADATIRVRMRPTRRARRPRQTARMRAPMAMRTLPPVVAAAPAPMVEEPVTPMVARDPGF